MGWDSLRVIVIISSSVKSAEEEQFLKDFDPCWVAHVDQYGQAWSLLVSFIHYICFNLI